MKFVEIKKAINKLLKDRYPFYKIYGTEIKEGYTTPAFFTEILDRGSKTETSNFATGAFTVRITYFQDKKSELDQLEKVDEIKDLFGSVFCIGKRNLTVGGYSHDYVGEFSDILQISIEFDYMENTRRDGTQPSADQVNINITKK